jgi:hypothetical protein
VSDNKELDARNQRTSDGERLVSRGLEHTLFDACEHKWVPYGEEYVKCALCHRQAHVGREAGE